MKKIRRQTITFLFTGTLIIQTASALDSSRLPEQAARTFSHLFTFLQNPYIRAGLTFIALIWLFYAIINTLLKRVSVFSENSKLVAIPLAVLLTLSIFWKIKIETLSNMFIWFLAALIVTYLIKAISWASGKISPGYNPGKAIKDEKRVMREAKESVELEKEIFQNENAIEKEIEKERYDSKKTIKHLENMKSLCEKAQKDIKKIFSDTRRE